MKLQKELVKDVETKTKKLSKEELLEMAAVGTTKITNWLVKTTTEWDDDPDLPELEEISEIEKREEIKKENREIVKDVLEDMMEEAVRKLLLHETWNILQFDDGIREAIIIKMRMAEEWKARDAELSRMSLSSYKVASKTTTKLDTFTPPTPPNWEIEARDELDQVSREQLVHTGEVEYVQCTQSTNVQCTQSTDVQWEELANLELEGVETVEEDRTGKEMMFYLENTDILVKRLEDGKCHP